MDLSPDGDLVRQARVPAEFVDAEAGQPTEMRRRIDMLVEASNGFIAQHGAFGDEFSTL